MSTEPNNPTPTPNPTPAPNDPAARNPDGTLKEPNVNNSTPQDPPKDPPKEPDPKDPPKEPTVPEKYEFKDQDKLDAKLIEAVTPVFKELKLDNAGAQKLIDFWNAQMEGFNQRLEDAAVAQRDTWRAEIAKDPKYGDGKDSVKPEVKANIAAAIGQIGDQAAQTAFKQAMDETGVGDHPAFIRAMAVLGEKLGEGKQVNGNPAPQKGPTNTPQIGAASMYPGLPSANSGASPQSG